MAASALTAHDPRQAGGYRLEGRLGRGGQGTVYLGRDVGGAPVAVKILDIDVRADARARDRFLREIEAARKVASFCTAQIVDAQVDGDFAFVVSEFIAGRTLAEHVEQDGPVRGAALVRLAVSTATALTAIHGAGVVHCDLKPGNVICGPDGARVIDFGIARAVGERTHSTIMGSPAYMAPERFSNQAVGPPADVFAWAGTIAYAAAGDAPFGTDAPMAIMQRVVHEPPRLGGLDAELSTLLRACLHKDPAARPTARQVMLRLVERSDETTVLPPPGPPVRSPFLDPGGILLAVALGGAGAVVGGQAGGGAGPALALGTAAFGASYLVRTLTAARS